MGFLDLLGELAGGMAARGAEIKSLQNEYKDMTDRDLELEYRALKGKNGTDNSLRYAAVTAELKERGFV